MKAKTLLVALLLAMLLVGCQSDADVQKQEKVKIVCSYTHNSSLDEIVYRFYDADADVVCWVYSGYREGGVSCLPRIETALLDER